MDDHRSKAEQELEHGNSFPAHAPESVATSLRAMAEALLALDDTLRKIESKLSDYPSE